MLLTLVAGVESLLKAALGPKPGYPWPVWVYYNDEAIALPEFLDHPVKESHVKVSISNESGTGDTNNGSLWFRQVANRST